MIIIIIKIGIFSEYLCAKIRQKGRNCEKIHLKIKSSFTLSWVGLEYIIILLFKNYYKKKSSNFKKKKNKLKISFSKVIEAK